MDNKEKKTMRKIILPDRLWRAYRALWLLMVLALVADLCAVVAESGLLQDAAATISVFETADWISFSAEAVALLALTALLWLLRKGRGVGRGARCGFGLAALLTLLYAVASKLPTMVFGPLSLDDGYWAADLLNTLADILLPVVPVALLVAFLLCAQCGGRVGRWCVSSAVSMALLVPATIAFMVNDLREQPSLWAGLLLGTLLAVLFLLPAVALRCIAGGDEDEQ